MSSERRVTRSMSNASNSSVSKARQDDSNGSLVHIPSRNPSPSRSSTDEKPSRSRSPSTERPAPLPPSERPAAGLPSTRQQDMQHSTKLGSFLPLAATSERLGLSALDSPQLSVHHDDSPLSFNLTPGETPNTNEEDLGRNNPFPSLQGSSSSSTAGPERTLTLDEIHELAKTGRQPSSRHGQGGFDYHRSVSNRSATSSIVQTMTSMQREVRMELKRSAS